jgi:hypothetical protein
LAMSERRLRAPDICGSTVWNCFSSRPTDPAYRRACSSFRSWRRRPAGRTADEAPWHAGQRRHDSAAVGSTSTTSRLSNPHPLCLPPMRAAVGVIVVLASPILLVWSMGLWHWFHGTLHDSPLRDVAFYPLTSIVAHVVGVGLTILIIPRLWDLVRRGSPAAMRWLCRAASSLTRAASRHRRISLTRT